MFPAAPEFLRPGLSRPVAVFGGGVSGRGVLALLDKLGVPGFVFDEKGGAGAAEFRTAEALDHPVVVFSPGFAPSHRWLAAAQAAGSLCLSEIDFASLFWKGRVVAVTGTNGKTTLTEFLTHALQTSGQEAHSAGNIGLPLSQLAAETEGGSPDAYAICEVSSFQAETLRSFRSAAALWTNFAEDHLERHLELDAYFRAKAALATRADVVFAGSSVRAYAEGSRTEREARQPATRKSSADSSEFSRMADVARSARSVRLQREFPNFVWVETSNQPGDRRLDGTAFAEYPQRENFLMAAAWWRASGRSESALFEAARSFRLGRHRLAQAAVVDGVAYWNDSKATNFHAVEAALARFPGPVLLIAGGKPKGGDLEGFATRIAPRVKGIWLIGETRAALAALCKERGVPSFACDSLAEAVRGAASSASPGDNVLLSPGFASFDMFRGYADRGAQFERIVRELASPVSGAK